MSAEIIDLPGRRPTEKAERAPAARFWMKFNIPTFMAKTAALDTTAIGALVLLESYYFLRGELPKTDQDRARVCKLTGKKFAAYREQLLSFFDDEGRSAELDATIEEIERISSTRRDAGRRGGASKSQANAKQEPQQTGPKIQIQIDSQIESPEQKQLRAESTPTAPSPPPSLLCAREGDEIAAQVLAPLSISQRANPGWRGLGSWMAQLLADGAEPVDITVGVAGCLRSLNDQPPSSFTYFSKAIERAKEARTRPLPQVVPAPKADQHKLGEFGDNLRRRLGDDVFASWFCRAKLGGIVGDTATLIVATRFIQTYISSNFQTACLDAFRMIDPKIACVVVAVEAAP